MGCAIDPQGYNPSAGWCRGIHRARKSGDLQKPRVRLGKATDTMFHRLSQLGSRHNQDRETGVKGQRLHKMPIGHWPCYKATAN